MQFDQSVEENRANQTKRSDAIRLLCLFGAVAGLLTACSWLPACWAMLRGTPPEQALRWLWFPHPGFDLWCYTGRFTALGTPDFFARGEFPWSYPAVCALVYEFFYIFNLRGEDVLFSFPVYSLLATGGAAALLVLLARALRIRGGALGATLPWLIGAMVFSWPLFFAQQRGNLEAVLWLGAAAGLLLARQGRWTPAAICFGPVAAAKLYPVLLFGLLLPRRRWAALLAGLVTAVALTVAALRVETPDIALSWHRTQAGIDRFVELYTLRPHPNASGYDHSLFALLKAFLPADPTRMHGLLHGYLWCAGAAAAVLFLLRIMRMSFVNQLTSLTVLTVLLPPTSFDYTLCLLYVPWGLLLLAAADSLPGSLRGTTLAMILFAVLMAPETFLVWNGVLVAGQVKAIALLALLVLSVITPWGRDPRPVPLRN